MVWVASEPLNHRPREAQALKSTQPLSSRRFLRLNLTSGLSFSLRDTSSFYCTHPPALSYVNIMPSPSSNHRQVLDHHSSHPHTSNSEVSKKSGRPSLTSPDRIPLSSSPFRSSVQLCLLLPLLGEVGAAVAAALRLWRKTKQGLPIDSNKS